MKPIALPVALACSGLLALRAAAATPDVAPNGAEARVAVAAAIATAPESPAAAFERMLAPRAPVPGPAATGVSPDALTRAFNVALWDTPAPAVHQAKAPAHPIGSAQ